MTSVGAVALLELVEARSVDETREDLADLVGMSRVGVDDAVDLARIVARILGRRHVGRHPLDDVERADDRAREMQRVGVVFGEVVRHSGQSRVDVGAAEVLGRHFLAGRGLHERRTAKEDGPRAVDDDRFVRHRRNVGAARGARSHDDRNLRNALGRHPRLVVEDAAEVLAVGEHLGLQRQERAARVDEIDARQAIVERDLLGPDVLLDRERIVGAALDRRIVGDDDHIAPRDAPDAGDQAGGRGVVVVDVPRGERRELEKRRVGIEQLVDAFANRELALRAMPFQVLRPAALTRDGRRSRSSLTSRSIRALLARKVSEEVSM